MPFFVELDLPDKVILDFEVFSKGNKSDYADSFSFLTSLKASFFDLKVSNALFCTCENQTDYVEKITDCIQKLLSKLNLTNMHTVLFVAQAYASIVLYSMPYIYKSAFFSAGFLLSCLSGGAEFECVNGLIESLLLVYKSYLTMKEKTLLLPVDYNSDISELATVLHVSELNLLQRQNVFDFNEIESLKKTAFGSDYIFYIDELLRNVSLNSKQYAVIYKGRKNRAGYNKSELLKTLKLGALITDSVLYKLIYHDGFLNLLN